MHTFSLYAGRPSAPYSPARSTRPRARGCSGKEEDEYEEGSVDEEEEEFEPEPKFEPGGTT